MNETLDRVNAYSFDLQADQAASCLRIGRKRLKVQVTQFSWSGYTISAPRSAARMLGLGRQGILEFQGDSYRVCCMGRDLQEDGSLSLQLQRIDDATKSSVATRKKRNKAGGSHRLSQGDSVLSLASCLGLVLILLILPGWGDGWGTSTYLSEGIKTFFSGGFNACRCVFGK